MKVTKRQLRRIIREGLADDAYEAGYNDALRDRPHGSNPDMRDLDPRSYDHGFDKGTAERMDLQRPSGTRGFYEGDLQEQSSRSDELEGAESWRRATYDEVQDAEQLIYYSLVSAEDDISHRGIKLQPGEFVDVAKRVLGRFR
jgi:hypothetical protein